MWALGIGHLKPKEAHELAVEMAVFPTVGETMNVDGWIEIHLDY